MRRAVLRYFLLKTSTSRVDSNSIREDRAHQPLSALSLSTRPVPTQKHGKHGNQGDLYHSPVSYTDWKPTVYGMEQLFETLQEDTQSLWQNPHGSVRRLRRMPSAGTFFREYVATSTPVIIEGGASSWDAASSWDLESLGRTNPELEVCSI